MDCALVKAPERTGHCVLCDVALTGRRIRWCSDAHAVWYARNHTWTMARHEALRRAAISIPLDAPVYDRDAIVMGETRVDVVWRPCDDCGRDTRFAGGSEVNHVEPRNGQPYDGGCWNHQTNLQVLCHECHVAETNRQRRARSAVRVPDYVTRGLA